MTFSVHLKALRNKGNNSPKTTLLSNAVSLVILLQRVILSFDFPFYGHYLRQVTIATGGEHLWFTTLVIRVAVFCKKLTGYGELAAARILEAVLNTWFRLWFSNDYSWLT